MKGELGENNRPLSIGVQVTNANVKLINLIISDATTAAVEIAGDSKAELRDSRIKNSAVGVRITGNAAPHIAGNHFSAHNKDIQQSQESRAIVENNQMSSDLEKGSQAAPQSDKLLRSRSKK